MAVRIREDSFLDDVDCVDADTEQDVGFVLEAFGIKDMDVKTLCKSARCMWDIDGSYIAVTGFLVLQYYLDEGYSLRFSAGESMEAGENCHRYMPKLKKALTDYGLWLRRAERREPMCCATPLRNNKCQVCGDKYD